MLVSLTFTLSLSLHLQQPTMQATRRGALDVRSSSL